ncbi:hypothetical protein EDD22DRAFT_1015896 [Suillus occidentalis]|nr:hypothetical protein EDD22DRAFT_1015896 [Suillus occidentalis]
MPPSRQRVRHSACLKANPLVHLLRTMDNEGSNIRGPAKPPQDHVPRLTIQWQSDRALTDILVNHLTMHPADCRVLCYSDGKKAMSTVDDGASGLDKGQVYTTLAKLIFTDHPSPRGKYKKLKATFSSTGTGVMPDGGMQMKNLLDAALIELPWYTELDAIWHANPSMAAKTHSSKPGVNHAGTLFSLVKLHDGAGPPTQFDATASSCIFPTLHQSNAATIWSCSRISLHPPYNWSPHLPGLLALDDDDDDNDDMDVQETSLGDTFHHLEGDKGGDFSKATGKKRQLLSSPSPPPEPPEPFAMPAKSPASVYNSCSVFGSKKPSSRDRHCRLPSEVSVSTSAPSSTTRNTSSSDYLMSSTPHTSLPNSASGSKKKKAKSDIMQHVDDVKDELASMQSDVMLRHDNKHHRFLAKLEAKTEHTRDTKRYEWLHATHEHEALQATISHQHLQETRDTEIRLHETDIRVYEAHSLVLDKEAKTLRLKIQFQQMMQGSKPSDGE